MISAKDICCGRPSIKREIIAPQHQTQSVEDTTATTLPRPSSGCDSSKGDSTQSIVKNSTNPSHSATTYPQRKWNSPTSRKRRRHWQHRSSSVSQSVSHIDDMPSSGRKTTRSTNPSSAVSSSSSVPHDTPSKDGTPSTSTRPRYSQNGSRASCRVSVLPTPLPISPNGTRPIRGYCRYRPSTNSESSPNQSSYTNESEGEGSDVSSDGSVSNDDDQIDARDNNTDNKVGEVPPRKKRKCDSLEPNACHSYRHDSTEQKCESEHPGILGVATGLWQTMSEGLKTLVTKTYESSLLGIKDLTAAANGGKIVYYSNAPTGRPIDGILNCTGLQKGEGWVTEAMAVTKPPQYEWCIIRLGSPGVIKGVLLDTTDVPVHNPMAISVEAAFFPNDTLEEEIKKLPSSGAESPKEGAGDGTSSTSPLRSHPSPSLLEELLDKHSQLNSDQWKDIRPVTFITSRGIQRFSVSTYDRIQSHVRVNLFVVDDALVSEMTTDITKPISANNTERILNTTSQSLGSGQPKGVDCDDRPRTETKESKKGKKNRHDENGPDDEEEVGADPSDAQDGHAVSVCGLTRIGVFGEVVDADAGPSLQGYNNNSSTQNSENLNQLRTNPCRRPSILKARQDVVVGRPTPLRPHWLSFRKSVMRQMGE